MTLEKSEDSGKLMEPTDRKLRAQKRLEKAGSSSDEADNFDKAIRLYGSIAPDVSTGYLPSRQWTSNQESVFQVLNGKKVYITESKQGFWYISIPAEWSNHTTWLSRKDVVKLRKELKRMLAKADPMT